MKKLKINKTSTALLLSISTLFGCSADDPVATDIPERAAINKVTSADITGSAIKGTLSNGVVSLQQMNGADISILSTNQTDADGAVNLEVQANAGFGIDSMFKVTVTAASDTQMMCDAITCASVGMGEVLSGSPLTGSNLTTLTYVNVPLYSQADGTADATFNANALTTIATSLIEQAVTEGRNVAVRQLYELALEEYSATTLKALGVFSPGTNVYQTQMISAESYQNFVVGEDCQMVSSVDEDGNPIVDEDGNPIVDEDGNPIVDEEGNPIDVEACTDVLADNDLIKLSLANAAFANISEFEGFNALYSETASRIQAAIAGDAFALAPIRERLLASVKAVPFLAELGLTAEQVIDVELTFLDDVSSGGPVQEVTTAENIATAIITARNRIGDGEIETKAFDGDLETKWLDHNDWAGAPTIEDPSWVQVQFAEAHAVSSLFITSANDADGRDPENFNLAASNDGVNWVTLASFLGESFDERLQRKEFRFNNGIEYSYYRLNITKNKGDDTLMQIAEIQLVGPVYASVDHTKPVGTGVITARNFIGDGEAPTMAFDGDLETKWLDHNDWSGAPTVEDPSWVQIDFPAAVAVNSLGITSANDADGRDPENFTLVGSNDAGVTWTVLGEWLGESFDERFERKLFSVDNILAFETYRLNITKNKGDDTLMQVAEIEFIGPILAGLNHGRTDGAIITARNRIGDGEVETKAFDGDIETKWLDHNDWSGAPTVEDPSWVQVQLPAAATVNKLGIVSANDGPGRDPENFDLLASNDGENWIVLNSWIGESFDERFERKQYSFGNDLGFSFYRLNITKNKGDDTLMQVAEIELLGPQYSSVDHSSAADAVITARNRIGDGELETKAFDGDVETKWLDHNDWAGAPTAEDPSWVQVDFSNARIVTSIAITSANDADGRDPENFNLVGSNDGGVTWQPIASWIGESFDNRFERKLFEMGNGFAYMSYRLNITKNKGDDTLMQIAEIELIGPEL
ncbi:discoidin domain-containing protein [Paraglaciecola arctica]|uniref:Coagulation factor 5/8 type-like n=1 Tax=Paraglaciecola arctica BSs20135 TaxID=493475 RepID=K6YUI0_9ALTE|nr:discoidin domain-containing protein [Paraglaciecola arctica]GAC20353.1 coagulation factor 5/8 type-like [Paraglaciecola arctica BSs20135]